MTHEEVRELIPGYALDALEPEEAGRVEAHLPSCSECRRELALLRGGAISLATGVAQITPPPEVRDRIIAAIGPERRRIPVPPRGWVFSLAVATALVIVLGGIDVSLLQRLAVLNARVKTQTQLLALLATPSARTVTLAGTAPGVVRLVFDPSSHRGALIAAGLQDPGQNLVYQLWLVGGQTPESAGVFRPALGEPTIVTVAADFSRYHAVAISVEHAPHGAPHPTTTPILTGALPGSG